MNLLLLEAEQLRGTRAALSAIQARHARDVLHVVPGQELRIGMLDGPRGVGRVVHAEDGVELECTFELELPSRTGERPIRPVLTSSSKPPMAPTKEAPSAPLFCRMMVAPPSIDVPRLTSALAEVAEKVMTAAAAAANVAIRFMFAPLITIATPERAGKSVTQPFGGDNARRIDPG